MLDYLRLVTWRAFSETIACYGGWWSLMLPAATFAGGMALHWTGTLKFPWLEDVAGSPLSQLFSYAIYGVGGVVVVAIVIFAYRVAVTPANLYAEMAAEIEDLSPGDNLDLYFHSPFMAGGKSLQFTGATLTNRSNRHMHLHFMAHVDYLKDSGEWQRLILEPEWNPEGLTERTGWNVIDLPSERSLEGRLVVFLPDPAEHGVTKWNVQPWGHVAVVVFDSVSGKSVAFLVSPGCPEGRLSWPLPPVGGLRSEIEGKEDFEWKTKAS